MDLPELGHVLTVRPGLRVEPMGHDSVFLIGEGQRFVLSDFRATEVIALVDGRRSVADILRNVGHGVSEAEALYVLGHLIARGYLVPAATEVSLCSAAFWHGVGIDPAVASQALPRTPVSVQYVGDPAFPEAMADALRAAGVRIDGASPFKLVVANDYLRSELSAININMLRIEGCWALIKVVGTKPLFGPVFRRHGPCWDCLAFWMRNNRPVEEMVRRRRGHVDQVCPPPASIEASIRTACGFAALLIARAVASRSSASGTVFDSTVLSLDFGSLQTTAHTVVKRPQCPSCGDASLMRAVGDRPIELRPVEKAHATDGGYRRQTPRETYDRYRHLIGPLTGPVTHVVQMPGRDTELRAVYASGYMVCPRGDVPNANDFDKPCAGKGRSPEQARVSALCEALERFSGVYQGDEARVRATSEALGSAAVPPADLLNFSQSQYLERNRINRFGSGARERVPAPLDSMTEIDWTPAWSLTHKQRRYIPLTYCYSEAPTECGTLFCRPCGNGVAAGTCLEEAILQGLLELIERDAVSIWWYNKVSRPAIDIDSFNDGYFDDVRADYARLGWTVWVLDLTHDLRIPTCVALAREPNEDRFAIGFGCHLQPRLAVQRALTELNQLFDPTGQRRAPWDLDRLFDREYLFPQPDVPSVSSRCLPRIEGADLQVDIEKCMNRLQDSGLELIVVDKTRPDINLNVAQVIVPGLRHFWPRFAPGRLYDVPFNLGWRLQPLVEVNLNSVPLLV